MNDVASRVFLSYSTKDAILARIIAHIFRKNGVSCFLAERDLPVGSLFDSKIYEEIKTSDLLLVLWSSNSASSPWVNQEVGVALAQNIPVWPIAVEEITIQGAMFRNQGFYLIRHSDPYTEIRKLAQEIRRATPEGNFKPTVDQYLLGREPRTEQIIEIVNQESSRLRQESSKRKGAYTLRTRASFSCFSISPDKEYFVSNYHTKKYHELLVQELEGVKGMIQKGAFLKAIIWPWWKPNDQFMKIKYRNLINFLESNEDFGKVRFVLGRYQGGHQYIFDTNVLVEGSKTPESKTPGYELTTLTYHRPTITSAINSFDARFNELWKSHAEACTLELNDIRTNEEIHSYVINELKNRAENDNIS